MRSILFLISILIIQVSCQQVDWDYVDMGKSWGAKYKECHSKLLQSPINIKPSNYSVVDRKFELEFFDKVETQVNHISHTLKSAGKFSRLHVTDVSGNYSEYEALQFHIHAPSEYTVDGRYYDAEIHIVHEIKPQFAPKTTYDYAVLGLFFEAKDTYPDNPFFEHWDVLNLNAKFQLNMKATLGAQLPQVLDYFTFHGSLTTPPCSEVVNWFVIEKPLQISVAQLNRIKGYFGDNPGFKGKGNNRAIMPRGNREIIKSQTKFINGAAILKAAALAVFALMMLAL